MNRKLLIIIALVVISCAATLGLVIAGTLSGTIEAQYNGGPVVNEPLGTTIQLHCLFSDNPSSNAVATVTYRYSSTDLSDIDWLSVSMTTITTIPNWNGAEQIVPYTLDKVGYYRFYLSVNTYSGDSVTVHYPASGSFSSPPAEVLPEAPPIAGLAIGFAALGLFVVMTKRRTKQSQATLAQF